MYAVTSLSLICESAQNRRCTSSRNSLAREWFGSMNIGSMTVPGHIFSNGHPLIKRRLNHWMSVSVRPGRYLRCSGKEFMSVRAASRL